VRGVRDGVVCGRIFGSASGPVEPVVQWIVAGEFPGFLAGIDDEHHRQDHHEDDADRRHGDALHPDDLEEFSAFGVEGRPFGVKRDVDDHLDDAEEARGNRSHHLGGEVVLDDQHHCHHEDGEGDSPLQNDDFDVHVVLFFKGG
jgi:hypothetical protein